MIVIRNSLCAAALLLGLMSAPVLHTQPAPTRAANQVARLHVVAPGVEVQRLDTATWVPIRVESLVGVGDNIRTTDKGRATLDGFDGVLEVTIAPNSAMVLRVFSGDTQAFMFTVKLLSGFANYRTRRILDGAAQFIFETPTFSGSLANGAVDLRVEADGRSAALLTAPGTVTLIGHDQNSVTLVPASGVRAQMGAPLSEDVHATSFVTLDSALDGCPSTLTLNGDVTLNVRLGPAASFDRVGGLDSNTPLRAMGVTNGGGWYRIRFLGGFGWIKVDRLPLNRSCAGLRHFPDKFGPEDHALYQSGVGTPAPF